MCHRASKGLVGLWQMGLVDRKLVTHSSFLDLFLLAESDYFIGTLSSAFRYEI